MSNKEKDIILVREEAVDLIRDGVVKIQSNALEGDRIMQILHPLSLGFEKLFKSIILVGNSLRSTAETSKYYKGSAGHDLLTLLDYIRSSCFLEDYLLSVPIGRSDKEYLASVHVLAFFEILGFYSQKGRYDKIDNIIKNSIHTSPEELWYTLEQAIIYQKAPELFDNLGEPDALSSALKLVRVELVVMVERTVRALARLLTIGGLAGSNKSLYIPLKSFLFIQDDKLGHRQYRS
ncbi:MAG: hypothetical protein IID14_03940 [Candidatus Marinimicrobia bacterium]|nr:hypothetical protein [Candidatus Neomarinimicrobiota bacterium]